MKLTHRALAGLAALLLAGAAPAAFIDERKGPEPKAKAGALPEPQVTGAFLLPSWRAPIGQSLSTVTLGTALVQLQPPGPPLLFESVNPALLDRLVSVSAGEPRIDALRRISALERLHFHLEADSRRLRVVEMPLPVAPTAPTGAVAVAGDGQASSMKSPAVAPSTPKLVAKRFEVRPADIRLANTLDRWAKEAGVRIRWDADQHVLIGAPMTYQAADVFDAVAELLASPSIKLSAYPLEVCEYPNVPRLLRVTRQGEQARECAPVAATTATAAAPAMANSN